MIHSREILTNLRTSMQSTLERINTTAASEDDVHKHTKQLGKLCHHAFYPIDQRFNLADNSENLEAVMSQILSATAADKFEQVFDVLQTIQKCAGSIEAETKFDAADLLKRTWNLATQLRTGYHGLTIPNALELVVNCLAHNVEAKGGCLAGICGRLIHTYSNFVHQTFQRLPDDKISFREDSVAATSASPAITTAFDSSFSTSRTLSASDFEREEPDAALEEALRRSTLEF